MSRQKNATEYWVIDPTWPPELKSGNAVKGPFSSVIEAEKHLAKYHEELINSSDMDFQIGDNEWSEPMIIVQTVKMVRPVPVASVKVVIREEQP